MQSKPKLEELEGLSVMVDRVVFYAEAQTPPDRPFCFVYYISILNGSDVTVTIHGRKWVVTNERNEVTVVEGEGVVGEHPRLKPGEKFSYNSYHLMETRSGVAEGSYLGETDDGRRVVARIPKFEMCVPDLL